MNIRDATEVDLNAINDIYNYYVLNTTSTAQETMDSLCDRTEWFNKLTALELPVIVAEINGQVIGWGALTKFNERSAYRYCVENSVYLNKSYCSSGIGTVLINELISRSKNGGFKVMIAKINAEQQRSISFHEKHGFKTVGCLENVMFKFNRWSGVVLMQRNLL